jgi:hypothetical protein
LLPQSRSGAIGRDDGLEVRHEPPAERLPVSLCDIEKLTERIYEDSSRTLFATGSTRRPASATDETVRQRRWCMSSANAEPRRSDIGTARKMGY